MSSKSIFILLIVVLGLALYINSLNGEFIRDDIYLVKNNEYIKTISNLPKVFTRSIAAGGRDEWNSYRPVQMITFMVDHSIWGLNVKGYHLTNTLLHILAAISIYLLINILYGDRLLSFFASILFVAHPIHTGAVAFISGRADSLAAIFMILTIILYIRYIDLNNTRFFILSLLTYTLALLSRENAIILPFILLLYHYAFKKKLEMKLFLSISGIALLYILARLTLLKPLLSNIEYQTTLFQRMPGFFVAITKYLGLLLMPFGLHMEY